jgi:hypothetical protein
MKRAGPDGPALALTMRGGVPDRRSEPGYQRIRDTSWTTRAVLTPVNVVVS